MKNILATVIAIARQTIGRDKASRVDVVAFETRLASLSRAQDLLIHEEGQYADLNAVFERAISHYPAEAFKISGPSVPLPPKAVIALSLALHELATNAAKYGALSVPEGRISVSWHHEPDQNCRLTIIWEEQGSPEVAPPVRKELGSTVIERRLSADLRATRRFLLKRAA